MKEFTAEELAKFNGTGGNPAYVAYKGVVYDVTESAMWGDGDHEGEPSHQAQVAERLVQEIAQPVRRDAREEVEVHLRDLRQDGRRSFGLVDVVVEVPRDPVSQEDDRGADHDLVGAQVDGEVRVDEGEQSARHHRDHQPAQP